MISRIFSRQRPVTLLDLLTAVVLIICVPINYNSIWFVIATVILLVARKRPQLDPVINPVLVVIVFAGLLGLSIYRLVYTADIWVAAWSIAMMMMLIYKLIEMGVTSQHNA